MTRIALIALSAAVLLSCAPAMASEEPPKDGAPTSHYIEFSTLTASVMRPDRRRGVMALDATLDIPDVKLRARAASLSPRLRAAFSQALTIYAAGLPPGRPIDPDYLAHEMQRQTDATIGRPGAKFLLGSVLVN
jgi:hypothetical protein